MTPSKHESEVDASVLFFGDIRFIRDTVINTLDVTGPIDGFGELLRWAIAILEYEVVIARLRGKTTVVQDRMTVSAAIDRADHLRTIYGLYYV